MNVKSISHFLSICFFIFFVVTFDSEVGSTLPQEDAVKIQSMAAEKVGSGGSNCGGVITYYTWGEGHCPPCNVLKDKLGGCNPTLGKPCELDPISDPNGNCIIKRTVVAGPSRPTKPPPPDMPWFTGYPYYIANCNNQNPPSTVGIYGNPNINPKEVESNLLNSCCTDCPTHKDCGCVCETWVAQKNNTEAKPISIGEPKVAPSVSQGLTCKSAEDLNNHGIGGVPACATKECNSCSNITDPSICNSEPPTKCEKVVCDSHGQCKKEKFCSNYGCCETEACKQDPACKPSEPPKPKCYTETCTPTGCIKNYTCEGDCCCPKNDFTCKGICAGKPECKDEPVVEPTVGPQPTRKPKPVQTTHTGIN